MKTALANLTDKLAATRPDELRELVADIVKILYLVHDEENPTPVLDSEKEWDGETLEVIASTISDAGFCVPSVAFMKAKR